MRTGSPSGVPPYPVFMTNRPPEDRAAGIAASTLLDTQTLPWRDSPSPGVRWKKIHFDGRASVVLLEFEPGASYAAHRHPAGEEYWVISGTLIDGGKTVGAGTWVSHPPSSVHVPRSEDGCLLLVRLEAPIEPVASDGGGKASNEAAGSS